MYAQQDMTDAERDHIRVITSDEYQAGIEQGWRLAEAYWMVGEARSDVGNG